MSDATGTAILVANRVAVFPGVRRGILRKPGTLVISRQRLIFLPHADPEDGRIRELRDCTDGERIGALLGILAQAAHAEADGFTLDRHTRGLTPPDQDGRLRLLPVGIEDDLLVPVADAPLLGLIIGPPAGQAEAFSFTTPTAPTEEQQRGWWGVGSGVAAAVLSLLGLPFLVGVSLLVAEEDDEVGAALFLLGAALLSVAHLATLGGAGYSFYRREHHRAWSVATVPFCLLTGVVLMAGAAVALDELFRLF